jgi:4-hydroxy-4-methyl-2-oxoglutarate aldolase
MTQLTRLLTALLCTACYAQVHMLTKEQMVAYTAKNPYERFEDGRPKVPDAVLEKMKDLTIEEIWSILPGREFRYQFAGNWQRLHPEKKLIGRAVTAQFMPARPDVAEVINADAKKRGWQGTPNQWVIDLLKPGDVVVVDLFGKVEGGTFVGDNLAMAIYAATGTGMVVDGGIRDMEGIFPIQMPVYFRGAHPSAIRDVMLTGLNVPVRIGEATVMPGDIVFGDRGGIYFIPPHLAEEIIKRAEVTHIHDEWTKRKFEESKGKYKSSDLYGSPRIPALKQEYEEYLKKRLEESKEKQ